MGYKMKYTGTTPIHEFNGKFVKREDLAYWSSLEYPSGSKVRQYMAMAGYIETSEGPGIRLSHLTNNMEVPPCLVGCSANSAMAIYVAATAKILGTKGIIYTAKRKVRSAGINYALSLGAEVNEMTPKQGYYLKHLQKHARQRGIDLKNYVMWDRNAAIQDTIDQCINVPENIKRIIVPTGSGLTAAGIMCGTIGIEIVAVCTSPMADKTKIMQLVNKMGAGKERKLGALTVLGPTTPYDTPVIESLPDGTPLDPYYSAKAWKYVERNDLLWPPGLRPVISMPEVCRDAFKDWKGPQ